MVVNPFPIAFDQVEITVSVNLLFPDKSQFTLLKYKEARENPSPRLLTPAMDGHHQNIGDVDLKSPISVMDKKMVVKWMKPILWQNWPLLDIR
jgi:hypothetical protein